MPGLQAARLQPRRRAALRLRLSGGAPVTVFELRERLAEFPDYYVVLDVTDVRAETRVTNGRDAQNRPVRDAAVVVVIC